MPARGDRKRRAWTGQALDPSGLVSWMQRYLSMMRVQNFSARSLITHESCLSQFVEWCYGRSLQRPEEITKPILERYQRHLFHYRHPTTGKPLTAQAQHHRMVPVRSYFRWLCRQNVLLSNPASELELPRIPRLLPKHVLTQSEAEQVLAQPDIRELLGLRDRAILEVTYSTAMRRSEISALDVHDIVAERGVVVVRQGKGHRDRVVPIGERALLWVQKYLDEVRPELVMEPDDGALFLNHLGGRLGPWWITYTARRYIAAAKVGKTGATHLFRHTAATLMLENGADIRFIQEMLGHSYLTSTQIYTQVSIRKLQAVHALTHPTAKLRRSDERAPAKTPSLAATPNDDASDAAQALCELLQSDDDDEDGDDHAQAP